MPEKISVCVIAGNEEENIRRCLESAKWADEIVVLDSYSEDRTVEICKEYTDRVYQHEWMGYIGQKNLIKDMAEGPWIFFLDADEEISPALRDEIIAEFSNGNPADFSGYEFPRLVRYLGRWIYHGDWYPDTKLRLFRKDRGECGGQEPHDRIHIDGRVKTLKGPLFHYTYRDISNQLATINRFSTISAIGKQKEHRRFYLSDLLIRPHLRFFRCYVLKKGFLDGIPGLIIAYFTALSVFTKYAKLWEIYLKQKTAEREPSNGPNHT